MDWTQTPEAHQFITQVAKKIVAQTAPEELDMADELLEDYFKDPNPPNFDTRATDDPLGFGINDLLVAATPAAAAVATAILGFFLNMVFHAAPNEGVEIQQSRICSLLSAQAGGPEKPPQLSSDQLARIMQIAHQTAKQYGLDDGQSYQMANALIVALVLPPGTAGQLPAANPVRKIKILFMSANPCNTTPLALGEEMRAIDSALCQAGSQTHFELVQQWAVRVSELQNVLLRHKPDVVHFSGHANPYGQIILEDLLGNAQPVPPQALRNLFHILKDNIRLVVLNACYSQVQAEAIADEIDCVVGMNNAITDVSALNFAQAFYNGLAYGKPVQIAFELGVNQIELLNKDQQEKAPRLLAKRAHPEEVFFYRA